ncbi:hypothetical protein G7Y31_11495 [Corynebacterium lizhenjunii]|uniref:DUF4405 domain-containing protein n=1 Tax=Corynebacterium lizhenjunii TaxID=2709394 RepID=A0A7T0KEK8_9CORY|nr:hypothetical protein [Corynebacterium lizhenjunii]QPK79094.1 hypothetical protein G7Y31_11495 [Corynebacterium lizhenjunii]
MNKLSKLGVALSSLALILSIINIILVLVNDIGMVHVWTSAFIAVLCCVHIYLHLSRKGESDQS